MKLKNILIMLIVLTMLVLPNVLAAENQITASLIRYEPLPAQPGQYVTIYVQLTNDGDTDAPRAAIEIVDSSPFRIVDENDRITQLGILQSKESSVWDFKLKVDSDAVVGLNKLKIKYTADYLDDAWREANLNIEVKPSESKLGINSVEIEPEYIYPGKDGTINLNLKNSASIVFRDISLKLNMYDTNGVDLPFIPINSVTEKHLSILKPGDLSKVSFSIKPYPDAEPGYYKLPLTMTFYDDEGNKNEQTDIVGIIVSASPELKIIANEVSSTKLLNEINLKCINKGINDLKFLDLEVLESDNYELDSSYEYYVGDLDSDDYRTADFNIISNENKFDLKIKATYKDANNKIYEKNIVIPITRNVNSGDGSSNAFVTFFVIVIIHAMGIYIYRLRKKIKHK